MKRFISVLAFVLLFTTVFSKSVFAQTTSATPSPQTDNVKQQTVQTTQYPMNANADVPQNLHTYTQSVVLELLSAFSCQISGINPLNPGGQCLGADPKTGKLGFVDNNRGAIGFITDTISMSFHIPVSSGQYIAHLSSNFGIAKPALAQTAGYGFSALVTVLPLWEAMRNIVYVFFVLIFLFIGIGIMFRLHIDPRTVMTIQNSLPKIVVGLILVTLSYAIAGFLVDMMYVSMYATYSVISGATDKKEVKNLKPGDIQNQNPFYAAGAIYDPNPFIGLPKLSQDAALGAVGILKNAAGIGDMQGLSKEDIKRLSTADKDGGGAPTVSGMFASMFNRAPDVINGIFDTFPSIGIGPFSTSLFSDLGAKMLSLPFKLTGLALEKTAIAEQATYSKLFENGGGDTMLGRIIRTASVIGGIYTGIQIGQYDFAASAHGEVGVGAGAGVECSGICSGPLGAAIGAFVVAPFIDNLLRTTLPNLIGFFIILSIVITALLKLWFTLIKSYIYILLYVILAPFWIAFGLFPGVESAGFKPWIRGLIANLAAFPVTYAMLLFAKILTEKLQTPAGGNFVPPLIGTQQSSLFAAVFGIAILLAIPEILNMVKKALKVPEGKMGAAVSGGIGAGIGFAKAGTSPVTERLIGHKNPMTGKLEGGALKVVGQKVGGNIANKFGGPDSMIRRVGKQVMMTPQARAQAEEDARRQEPARQEAQAAQARAVAAKKESLLERINNGDSFEEIDALMPAANIVGISKEHIDTLKSHEDLADKISEAAQGKAPAQKLPSLQIVERFHRFRTELINLGRETGVIKMDEDIKKLTIDDILEKLGYNKNATQQATGNTSSQGTAGAEEAKSENEPEAPPPSGSTA